MTGLVAGLIASSIINIVLVVVIILCCACKMRSYEVQNNTDMPMNDQSKQPTAKRPSKTDKKAVTNSTTQLKSDYENYAAVN